MSTDEVFVVRQSASDIVYAFVPVILQALLTITSITGASKTSYLKSVWLKRHQQTKTQRILHILPATTVFLSILYAVLQLGMSVCRTFGFLGFTTVSLVKFCCSSFLAWHIDCFALLLPFARERQLTRRQTYVEQTNVLTF